MGASTIAIRSLQDFQAKVEGGRLFDMGGSTVNYGTTKLLRLESSSMLHVHTIPKMTSLQMGHDLTAESPSQSFREGGTAGGLNKLSLDSVGGRLKDGLGR